jgi:phosphopentomutase
MVFVMQDFDMFGHRKDQTGYANALKKFDKLLPNIITGLNHDDLLIITADHGCDPLSNVRGHTREKVPLLIYNEKLIKSVYLDARLSFADIGQTVCYNFDLAPLKKGKVINEIF